MTTSGTLHIKLSSQQSIPVRTEIGCRLSRNRKVMQGRFALPKMGKSVPINMRISSNVQITLRLCCDFGRILLIFSASDMTSTSPIVSWNIFAILKLVIPLGWEMTCFNPYASLHNQLLGGRFKFVLHCNLEKFATLHPSNLTRLFDLTWTSLIFLLPDDTAIEI
uniref:CSON010588 protein n=1 Tax=Culicoides sonorensis TaxID=179676 RepID=A0A336M4J9_CULSO